jgi:hypothetical protein
MRGLAVAAARGGAPGSQYFFELVVRDDFRLEFTSAASRFDDS